MSREDDRLIANWLGDVVIINPDDPFDAVKESQIYGSKIYMTLPHYSTSDSDAIALLPVLVERGYAVTLDSDLEWNFAIWADTNDKWVAKAFNKPTIAAAITSACLALIDKER